MTFFRLAIGFPLPNFGAGVFRRCIPENRSIKRGSSPDSPSQARGAADIAEDPVSFIHLFKIKQFSASNANNCIVAVPYSPTGRDPGRQT